MNFLMVFDLTQFWLDGRPSNEYFWISHKISGLLTPLTPLDVHPQWFKTTVWNRYKGFLLLCSSVQPSQVQSSPIIHYIITCHSEHLHTISPNMSLNFQMYLSQNMSFCQTIIIQLLCITIFFKNGWFYDKTVDKCCS